MVSIYFNYAREILQSCFALKLQKCFGDNKTSPGLSVGVGVNIKMDFLFLRIFYL